ncbi:MAG: hypothetical protein JRI68_15255, partial [Deltaproteobacteria bacterium]|nr:hypothetical protein [Deltaproteobacteria bacterium]
MLRPALASLVTLLVFVAGCPSPPPPAPPPVPTATASAEPPAPPVVTEPPIWMTPAEVAAGCGEHLTAAEKRRVSLIEGAKTSTDGTLTGINGVWTEVDRVMGLAELVAAVHPDKPVREAAEKCHQDVQKFAAALELDREVYDALAAVDAAKLDPAAKRFLERQLRDYRRAGVDRDEATRNKLASLKEQIAKTGQDFGRNIREGKRSIKVTAAQLKGLPKDYLEKHKPGKDGKIEITTDYPDLIPLLSYADDEKVRKAMFIEQMNRAYPANEANMRKLLELRHQYATTLGFPDWASYNAGDKMLDDKKKIGEFIDKVAGIAKPKSEKELKDILARKKKDVPRA